MIQCLPQGQLIEHKITTLKSLTSSQLFINPECRAIMMPELASQIREILQNELEKGNANSQLTLVCTETLGDILDSLQGFENERTGSTLEDVSTIMLTTLRTVIKSVAKRQTGEANVQAVVSNMLALFKIMNPRHYSQYIENFPQDAAGRSDLLDFIMEVLGMFRDLIEHKVFPSDWFSMILQQNSIVLKALKQFAGTIRDCLKDPFEFQAWNNFFHCAVSVK